MILAYTPAPSIQEPRLTWRQVADDPAQYARALYAVLRELDNAGYVRILMQSPPRTEEWAAVNDRIGRAAAAFGLNSTDFSGL